MSSELKLKVVFDSSGAQAAADALPDAVDRANRKGGKKPWEPMGSASAGDYRKMAAMEREIKAQQLKEQQKAAQEAARKAAAEQRTQAKTEAETEAWHRKDLARRLKEIGEKNAAEERAAAQKLKEEQRAAKEASRKAAAEQRAQGKTEAETEAWHRKDLSRRLKEIGEKNAEAERAAKAEEARKKKEEQQANARYKQQLKWNSGVQQDEQGRKEKEEKQANAAYLKRLKWNSKLLEEQQKAGEDAKAGNWTENFGKALEGTLMRSLGPVALAAKAIDISWSYVTNKISAIYSNYESKITAGVDPAQVRAMQLFTKVGTTTEEQAAAMAARAQGNVNALATGGAGGNAYGFQYFGMTDFKRYREEGLPIAELLLSMTKRFKKEGGSEDYRQAAESIFGSDWVTMKGMLAYANRQDIFGKSPSAMYEYLEAPPNSLAQDARAAEYRLQAMRMSQKDLMGGVSGMGPSQMLTNVTSLQAMGGGDILSAISRGPQDQIVDNTARTATAVEQLAGRNGSTAQPAIIGR